MTDAEPRVLSQQEFFDEVVAVTRELDESRFLYLMLEEGGGIGVQWEQPRSDHLRRYRVSAGSGPACPHCVIEEAVIHLAPVLPLDLLRQTRARSHYEEVLRTGMRPCPAFARQAIDRSVTWLADCHGLPGDPHSDADCAEHSRPAPHGDPLDPPEPFSSAVLEICPADEVRRRLHVARDWRDAAQHVAEGLREADATWQFLRTSWKLGLHVPGREVLVMPVGGETDTGDRSAHDLIAAALRADGRRRVYEEHGCLIPDQRPGSKRMPRFQGAWDIANGHPVRTIELPANRPLSRRGRGVLLLYQARFAMVNRALLPDPADLSVQAQIYWEGEAALHVFEFSLLRGLGGDAYTAAVEAFRRALQKEGGLLARPNRILRRHERKALAQVFGEVDEEELHLWASVAYRNAIQLNLPDQTSFAEHLRRQADK
ncbi:hypothetical protein [Streptomyces sp. NPDC050988]|uniref:hypothetical protein n=1 Tax=Streptomyces sp. NPDC050988 TaxID=3365637 RepID=UPI00378A52C7